MPVATVAVLPSTATLIVTQTATLTATAKDSTGAPLSGRALAWTSSSPATATVSNAGVVTALAPGTTTITATSEGRSGTASVAVGFGPRTEVALKTSAAGIVNGMPFATQPVATIRDAYGNTILTDDVTVVALTASAGATLRGTITATAVHGLAAFVNVGIAGTAGVNYTLTFSAGALTPAAQTVTLAPFKFGSGTKIVGTDILAGLFRSNNPVNASCYWERLSGFGGTIAEIIANDIVAGPAVVAIDAADKGFSSSTCASWVEVTGPVTASPAAPFGVGVFIVGVDIAPGLYRSNNAAGASCYWERLSGFGGTSSDRIANDLGGGPSVVAIGPTDKGFSSSRCASWSQVAGPVTTSQTASFGDGTFIIGTDVAAGLWQSNGSGASCYWERLSGFGGVSADRIANFFGSAPSVVTISPTDKGFHSSGCGNWSKIG